MMLLQALLQALLVTGAPFALDDAATATRRVEQILGEPAYAFCHDATYPLTDEEALWCPLVEAEPSPHCPAFVQACKAPRADLFGYGRFSTRKPGDGEPSEARARGQGPSRGRAPEPPPEQLELPALGGLGQVLFWIVIGVGFVLLGVAVFRGVVRGERPEPEPDPRTPEAGDDAAARAAALRAMETDVERLLGLAQEAARRGAFGEAVDFSHAALLRRLDHEGLIHLHASRTNGEYLRELTGNQALLGPVREALRDIDRAQFSGHVPSDSVFTAIHRRVATIVKTVGPFALLLAVVLGSAIACDPDGAQKAYPWSTSPSGNEAMVELLRRDGLEVSYRTSSLADLSAEDTKVIVLLEDASITDEEDAALLRWVEEGGKLIVAGSLPPSWLRVSLTAEPEPHPDPQWEDYEVPLGTLPPDVSLRLDEEPDLYWLDARGAPYLAWYSRGDGNVLVFGDGRLFTNAALMYAGNAEIVTGLLRDLGAEVELVDAWATRGAETPAETISRVHLTAAVVQLLLLVLALYAWRGARFGRGRDPVPLSRRAFVQHAEAMGRQYEKARAATFAAGLFSAWVLERLRNRFSSAASAGLLGLAQEAARVSGRDETDVMRLLVAAHDAVESRLNPGGSGEDLALIRDLGRLMRDIGETT